ncbi:brachyurin-like [Uranotaenia lowii]|uniref:brachyurin-like n=1 Tax=Uranotaenia lowii TaxID=190385 RepID=UPI00247AB341|nr:brachyurin-like [Uranotaenia lowii]
MKLILLSIFCVASVLAAEIGYQTPVRMLDLLAKQKSSRIVNGQRAVLGQFPHQAFMIVTGSTQSWACGGSIISDEWILTAAHCVQSAISFSIQLGTVELQSAGTVHLTTNSYVKHPSYNPSNYNNDVAVIKLNSKITFNSNIQPITLPVAGTTNTFENNVATVSGFGRTKDTDTTFSNYLYYVNLTVMSNSACEALFGSSAIISSTLCTAAGSNPVTGTCGGDSGGPLIYGGVQIGIVSFGASAGCEKGYPNGYARVTAFRDWIKTTTGV